MPKKTKALKVTDQNKAWNKKTTPSAYKLDSIPKNRTILIVCEGQTEELYFQSFPVLGLSVKIFNLKGQSKSKLVESTQEILNDECTYDSIWCVFDMDVKRGEDEFSDFDNAIIKASNLNYKVAYSNDSFELWFYLHFYYTDATHLRTFYYEELGKKWNINYIKFGKEYEFSKSIYERLYKSQEIAIKNAKKLYENLITLPYHQQNPVTKVYELVEELNINLRR